MVQDIDIYQEICGKKNAGSKGKNTSKKPIYVTGHLKEVSRELIKLHKYVFITAYILSVNGLPWFISLSSKIIFKIMNHLDDRKSNSIFKDF